MGGEIALHPGIVSDVLPDGTYNLVNLESSTMVPQRRREHFQAYHVYGEGTRALYRESRASFVPITIVEFVRGRTRPGFELHGKYRFTYDRDEKKETAEGNAMRMHRLAVVGEMAGSRDYHDDF